MTIQVDVKPLGTHSALADGPFDRGYKELANAGYTIIDLAENAQLRIQQGQASYIFRNGNWVKEDVIYIPRKGNFLTQNSPINANPTDATNAHRNGKELYLTQEQLELALQNTIPFPEKSTDIPTKRFNSEELTIKAFGRGDTRKAQAYGDFLKDNGINVMPVYAVDKDYVNKQDLPFARKLWFGGLGDRSSLDGLDSYLHGGYWVRGVLLLTGEASS